MSRTPGHDLFARRRGGVLLHLTSLPGGHGIGDLGPDARRFVDWMHRAGLSLWQMLPIGPVGKGNSPYSGRSAFAGEPMLISLRDLVDDGLLPSSAARCPAELNGPRVKYAAARRFKQDKLHQAFVAFERGNRSRSRAYRDFESSNRHWLKAWCTHVGGEAREITFQQFVFDRQWKALRRYANRQDVRLVGDLPIFIELESADVEQHPELFNLDAKGQPRTLTGAKPDAFSRNGQLWGHPHYRWAAHRKEQWRWWTARFRQALDRFDAVRLDHFLGFVRLWHVPAGARTARRGRWRATPGRELLTVLRRRLGPLPVIAEDLGAITPAVERLRDDFDLPGMRILQWAFSGTNSPDLPHRYPPRSVVYPGTHDNETVTGWYRHLPAAARRRFHAYAGSAQSPADSMVRLAFTSPAAWAICQAQDLLGLAPGTRMNRPGVPRGNWTWRLSAGTLSGQQAADLHALCDSSGRLPGAAS
ncbi:MAG: 4-alpha-glucanotransferase [Phycisphaerales bacterium]|nr:4-alpha-glucanotransferase [Phycisphaerales bacterium]